MSNFNLRIAQIQANNFTTKPQNLPQFKNPYLLISKNAAYNKLAREKQGNLKKKKVQQQSQSQSQNQNQSLSMALDDEEDLARHAMREVYATDRREIAGYTLDKELSTPEHIVYANGTHVLFGLRGSSAVKDFVADAQIGLKSLTGFPDALSGTLLNRYARDEEVYNKIRAKYPLQHITMSGHSLGNALGMNLLKNHKSDKNLKFFGYNGWIHPDYNRDKRAYTTRQEGDIVSTFTPTNKTLPEDKSGLGLGGIGAAAIGAEGTRRLYKAKLAEATAEIERLQNRQDVALEAQGLAEDEAASMRVQVSNAFPEYTNFADIITEAPAGGVLEGYANVLEEGHPEMYVKTSEVDTLKEFMFRHASINNVSDYNFDDLREAIQEENADINLAAHPELTEATETATMSPYLNENEYFHNVYVTNGDDGVDELMDYRQRADFDNVVRTNMDSVQMEDAEFVTSEGLNDAGTIHMRTFADVTEGISGGEEGSILAGLETAAEAAGGAVTAAGMATALLGVAGIAGAAYYLYSHSANRFRLKKNQFSKGK